MRCAGNLEISHGGLIGEDRRRLRMSNNKKRRAPPLSLSLSLSLFLAARIEVARFVRSLLGGKLLYARSNGRITHPACDENERLCRPYRVSRGKIPTRVTRRAFSRDVTEKCAASIASFDSREITPSRFVIDLTRGDWKDPTSARESRSDH